MSGGHTHLSHPSYTINQGNVLGDRPCVRQSQLYRQHCGGNEMKALLGNDTLAWDTKKTEGCYAGHKAYQFNGSAQDGQQHQQQQQQQSSPVQRRQQQQYSPVQQQPQQQYSPVQQQQQGNPRYRSYGGGAPPQQQQYEEEEDDYQDEAPQYAPQGHPGYEMEEEEDDEMYAPPQQQRQQYSPPQQQQQQQQPSRPVSDSRAMRPGAGYANKQTYNIFTGE